MTGLFFFGFFSKIADPSQKSRWQYCHLSNISGLDQ